MTTPTLTAQDILTRARTILASGPLAGSYADCGAYCPWCAIAMAKNQLDMGDLFLGFSLLIGVSDLPLLEARAALSPYRDVATETLSQEGALEIMDRVLADEQT